MLYSILTQARDTLIRRAVRENVERRHKEQNRDTTNRRVAREDEERRDQEQVRHFLIKVTVVCFVLQECTKILLFRFYLTFFLQKYML